MKLRLAFPNGSLTVELADTPTARARQVVEPGTVCFWTEGNALALPFGRTPISSDERPKLASPCNVLGTLADYAPLRKVRPGDTVRVEKA